MHINGRTSSNRIPCWIVYAFIAVHWSLTEVTVHYKLPTALRNTKYFSEHFIFNTFKLYSFFTLRDKEEFGSRSNDSGLCSGDREYNLCRDTGCADWDLSSILSASSGNGGIAFAIRSSSLALTSFPIHYLAIICNSNIIFVIKSSVKHTSNKITFL